MAYEWLSGQPPFTGDTSIEITMHHLSDPPPSLSQNVASVTPAMETVLLKALAKDSQQRFASVEDFILALEQASMP
ncbi:MAG TPA: hypothetical protein VGN34_12480 [Ktedonobacteraceae bacterium]